MTGFPTAADAAHNNAAWCDAMSRAQGGVGVFTADAWSTPTRSPDFYPDAVTLSPATDADEVLARIDTGSGCSIKDSFATLDLAPAGFRVLFDATWISCPAPTDPAGAWQPVTAPSAPFPPALLDEPDVVVIGNEAGGAVLNYAANCVGVSNLFSRTDDVDVAWRATLAAAREHFPGAPLVGYERDEALAAALRNGFTALGPLRVWMKE